MRTIFFLHQRTASYEKYCVVFLFISFSVTLVAQANFCHFYCNNLLFDTIEFQSIIIKLFPVFVTTLIVDGND